MQKFTAMIEFPFDMFYPLMREFDETVIVNQSSLVGNVQTADITFDIEALPKVLSLFPTMDVTMHGLTPITETAKMIKTIAKKKSYVASASTIISKTKVQPFKGVRKTKVSTSTAKIRTYLSGGWRSIEDIVKNTKMAKSTIWNRLKILRDAGALQSRDIEGNSKEYRAKA